MTAPEGFAAHRTDLVRPREVTVTQTSDMGVDGMFDLTVMERGLRHVRTSAFPVASTDLGPLEAAGVHVEMSAGMGSTLAVLGRLDDPPDGVAKIEISGGIARCIVASHDWRDSTAASTRLMEALRDTQQPTEDSRVPIHFWTSTPQGPMPMRMKVEAPTWDEIAGNYPAGVRGDVAGVMSAQRRDVEGVALWQGQPGTGKTTALRALAHAWRDWCDIHVIVDPEVFLGEQASYLMNVLFAFQDVHHMPMHPMAFGVDGGIGMDDGAWDDDDGSSMQSMHFTAAYAQVDDGYAGRIATERERSRAKLLVLEDAGELVKSDARVSAGQALSRLLNVTDGILGQGANISVLVTTNEQIEALHPAIARPGRCWSRIEFPQFTPHEARDWLHDHGVERKVFDPVPLAQLYAWKRGDGSAIELDALRPPTT